MFGFERPKYLKIKNPSMNEGFLLGGLTSPDKNRDEPGTILTKKPLIRLN